MAITVKGRVVMLTGKEAELVQKYAKQDGVTLAQYVEDAIYQYLEGFRGTGTKQSSHPKD